MKQFIYAKEYIDDFSYGYAGISIDLSSHNFMVRDVKNGPVKCYPFSTKNLSYINSRHKDGGAFAAEFTIPDTVPYSDYTVIFIKKGKQFNERSKWTCTIHTGANPDSTKVAKDIEKYINNNSALGLSCEVNESKITIFGKIPGEDYEIVLADELYGIKCNASYAVSEFMGVETVKDLAAKCAADAGFEYTAEDALELYPALALDLGEQKEFEMLTFRFTEPRVVGTHEESIYQIIHIVFPPNNGVRNSILDKLGLM